MIVAGIDIGSLSTKAVIMQDGKIVANSVCFTGTNAVLASSQALRQALDQLPNETKEFGLDYIVTTGYGRIAVPFSDSVVTEISCHARANQWLFPAVRTILDMGGQDCKIIKCDSQGKVVNFFMNDKCAAGTGRYLERIAKTVEIPLDEIGPRSLEIINGTESISSFCVLFAQRDVIMKLRDGRHPNDILAGACDAIVERIINLVHRVNLEKEFAISGGVAKNIGVVSRIEKKLGLEVLIAPNPQIMGAIGAALFAMDKSVKGKRKSPHKTKDLYLGGGYPSV